MKILAFTDSHGSLAALKKIKKTAKEKNVDVIVCAGDISIFENNLNLLLKKLDQIGKPVLMLHGNHESEISMQVLCKGFKNITFFHRKAIKINDVLFLGYGGGGFSLKDKSFEKLTKVWKKKIKKEKIVLVTHAPPYNTKIDKILDAPCGNKSIKNFINEIKPIVAMSGHLHECNGLKQVFKKKTLIINPGPWGVVLKI